MTTIKNILTISIEHQTVLTNLWKPFAESNIFFGEYSFANTFLFRREHQFMYIDSDPPFVRGEFAPNTYYYLLTKLPKDGGIDELKKLGDPCPTLFPIPQEWKPDFEALHPQVITYRQDSDYLFRTTKMRTFSGRALSSRRNLLHQFEAHYVVKAKCLTMNLIKDAMAVLDEWLKETGLPDEKTDYLACKDALEFFAILQLKGHIVYADDRPVGFCIGAILTSQTAVLHFCKTIHTYKGVTPYLYREYAVHLPDHIEWINLEQDLGIESLRHAKEAYDPDLILDKFRLTLRL